MAEVTELRPAVRVAPPRRPNRTRGGLSAAAWPAIGVVVTVAVWWLLTSATHLVHPAVLPPPQDVWTAFNASTSLLLEATGSTLLNTVLGFLIAAVAGVLIGLLLASSRAAERMFSPILVAVNAVPKIAIGPLLVVTLGWGRPPILTMVFLLSFFPVVLSTATGLSSTPSDLVELAKSLDASRWQTFRKVRLPAALPQLFVGFKVAMPLAAIGVIIGEFQAGGQEGLGSQITQFSGVGDTATTWAAIILVGLMSIILYSALLLIERLTLPWVRETSAR